MGISFLSKMIGDTQCQKLLDLAVEVRRGFEPYGRMLTHDEKAKVLKFRTGGERIVEQVASIAERHPDDVPQGDIERMRSLMQNVARLRPLETAFNVVAELISDTVYLALGDAWRSTTRLYSILNRLAVDDPVLDRELEPVREFFALRKGDKAAPDAGAAKNG
jgi:hypothetical protein